jgi:hypothetical protein
MGKRHFTEHGSHHLPHMQVVQWNLCYGLLPISYGFWHTPKLLDKIKCESKVKIAEELGLGAHSLAHSTLGVEGRVGVLG